MTNCQTVRACAIQLVEDPADAPLITLWETDPRFQAALRHCEALESTRSQVDERPRCIVLVWQDFPTIAAVEAANAAWHNPTTTLLEHTLLTQGFTGVQKAAFTCRLRPQNRDSTWVDLVNTLK